RIERLVVMTDFASDEAVRLLNKHLRRGSVYSALERAGANAGERVRIGDFEFTWGGKGGPLRLREEGQ
ncbi:MAG: Obg family GTPase CgtA, partial [Dehalococcoidales bacterium]|nr:Obg family GTPase CgtA [Dehalococcoidales bacterium]